MSSIGRWVERISGTLLIVLGLALFGLASKDVILGIPPWAGVYFFSGVLVGGVGFAMVKGGKITFD